MKKYLVLSLICVCAVALGCSKGPKKPADLPALNPTVVTVTYDDGEPVADAQVVLRNPSSTGGRVWNVTGKTDASGKATMMTDGNWPGVPAGDYQGMVIKEISDVEEPTTVGGSAIVKGIKRYVATKYGDPHDSGLTASIQAGDNQVEFKVGQKLDEDIQVQAGAQTDTTAEAGK